MEPFKDELKLIKGWLCNFYGSWAEKYRSYGSPCLILMNHLRLSLWLASSDTNYMWLSLSLWACHICPRCGKCWGTWLSATADPGVCFNFFQLFNTHRLKLLKNLEFTFVIRGSTWPDLWLGGNVKYEKQQMQWKKYVKIDIWFIVIKYSWNEWAQPH